MVLMNLFRGTGLHGLTGMPQRWTAPTACGRCCSIHAGKSKICQLKTTCTWVEDSSNASSKYTRNFFRNEIIPAIQNVYPQAEENLLHTISRLQKTERLYSQPLCMTF
jgi:tRNA(Ile)-lysidine synthase